MAGLFFAFEGIDGSGKTTQIERLRDHLEAQGRQVIVTKEPTDGTVGKLLRHILQTGELDEGTVALLFAADRLDHVRRPGGLLEQLEDDVIILCDRFLLSSLAYNSQHMPLEWVLAINKEIRETLSPTAYLLLDLPEQLAMSRLATRADVQERYETLHQLHSIRMLYNSLAQVLPDDTILTIDGDADPDTVHARIVAAITPHLS